jgi:hypothetical protein
MKSYEIEINDTRKSLALLCGGSPKGNYTFKETATKEFFWLKRINLKKCENISFRRTKSFEIKKNK